MAVVDVIGLILGIFTMIVVSVMLIHFIKNEYKFSEYGFKFWKSHNETLLCILIFLSYIIFSIHTNINSTYAIVSSANNSFVGSWCLSYFYEMVSFTAGKVFLYLFFILRLHNVFKNSFFAVSTTKLKLIVIMVEIPLFMSIIIFAITTEVIDSSVNNWNNENIQTFAGCDAIFEEYETSKMLSLRIFVITLYLITELIFSIIIIRLFVSRVLSLSAVFDEVSIAESQNNNVSDGSIEVSPSVSSTGNDINSSAKLKNGLFLDLAIKTTNVIIVAICTNYIMLIKYGLVLPASLLNIDVFFNCCAVYLSYAFASKYYNMFFGVCHKGCYTCCVKICYCCCVMDQKKVMDNSNTEITNATAI